MGGRGRGYLVLDEMCLHFRPVFKGFLRAEAAKPVERLLNRVLGKSFSE